jgi:hypothetical protein
MEGSDGISSDEINRIWEELLEHEKLLLNFRIIGPGISGNITDGYEYSGDDGLSPTEVG